MSLVIPARNEARNLERVLPELPVFDEVVLVDGNSVDGTVQVAQALLPSVRAVKQSRTGKGNALSCGFAAATGDIVVAFDADGSADPAEIGRFVDALTAGADYAKGSRFRPGGGSYDITATREVGARLLSSLTNVLFRTSFSDLCYGYNAFWRDVLPELDLPATETPGAEASMCWGDGFEIETVLNCRAAAAGLKITEVASVERSRRFGETNLRTFVDGGRVLRTIVVEWRRMLRKDVAGRGEPRVATPDGRGAPAAEDASG